MGQHLSCVSKQSQGENRKPKTKKHNKSKKGIICDDSIVPAEADYQNATAPETSRAPIKFLDPAPSDFNLPPISPVIKKEKGGLINPPVEAISQKEVKHLSSIEHTEHPVDVLARQLAQGEAKPACWADLYWHLIGAPGLKTDEEKVRALFTWLCSKMAENDPFNFANGEERGDVDDNKKKKKKEPVDSPDVVLPKLAKGKANYVQAFESMCRYSNIPCVTVCGIAKSMDYKVGQPLLQPGEQLFHPETGAMPPQIANLQHTWNAAFIGGKWKLFDCTWAAQRLAMGAKESLDKASAAVTLQYETDMFYYQVDPAELIYTHYPFEDTWQLLDPPVSIVTFATCPLMKPAFFQYGLGLFSHLEGSIPAETNLVLKLKLHPSQAEKLMFTYQLNLENFGNVDVATTKTRFGMHEVSLQDSSVNFRFRLPKKGDYSLIIYARLSGEQLFSDVCEYRVSAKGPENQEPMAVLPFPPTAQASYGPTEKAFELGLETLPRQLQPLVKSPKGSVELRFIASEPVNKVPRLTARLKSLVVKDDQLENCILLREIEASLPTTGVSILTGMGPCVPMSVLNAYLPEVGEYALEIYAAPHTSEEPNAYHLAWQFLIEADKGKPLSDALRTRLATLNLGASDESWEQMGFRALSHPDPVIRVRTAGRAGSSARLLKATSKSQVLQRYMESNPAISANVDGEDVTTELPTVPENGDQKEVDDAEEKIDPEAADVTIVLGLPDQQKICLISQLVDISGEEEDDVTGYLLQQTHCIENDEELAGGDRSSKTNSVLMGMETTPSQLITLLVRIPRGGAFYKLYLYAVPMGEPIMGSIPLIYTYLIDAPLRLTSAEEPYIGARAGEFPEKIAKRQKAEQQQQQQNEKSAATAVSVA